MTKLFVALGLGTVVMAANASQAQDTSAYPDIRGRWKGVNEVVVHGSGGHHPEKDKPNEARTGNKEIIVDIKGQEGRRFWGEVVSKDATESFLGVFGSDRSTLYWVDHDGHTVARLVDRTKIDACYLQPGRDFRVAACNLMTKQ